MLLLLMKVLLLLRWRLAEELLGLDIAISGLILRLVSLAVSI